MANIPAQDNLIWLKYPEHKPDKKGDYLVWVDLPGFVIPEKPQVVYKSFYNGRGFGFDHVIAWAEIPG